MILIEITIINPVPVVRTIGMQIGIIHCRTYVQENDVCIGIGIIIENVVEAEGEIIISIGKDEPLPLCIRQCDITRPALTPSFFAEYHSGIGTFLTRKVVKVNYLWGAIIINNNNFHIISHGDGAQTTLQQFWAIFVRNDDTVCHI